MSYRDEHNLSFLEVAEIIDTTVASDTTNIEAKRHCWFRYITEGLTVDLRNELATLYNGLIGFMNHQQFHLDSRGEAYAEYAQYASIALLKAIEGFDFSEGRAFTTYAFKAIYRWHENFHDDLFATIKIPRWVSNELFNLKKAIEIFTRDHGYAPGTDDDSELVSIMQQLWPEKNYTSRKVIFLIQFIHIYRPVSLTGPVNNQDDAAGWEDFLSTDNLNMLSPLFFLDTLVETNAIVKREQRILSLRLVMTLEEVGNLPEFELTKERIRQLEGKALKKIREHLLIGGDTEVDV